MGVVYSDQIISLSGFTCVLELGWHHVCAQLVTCINTMDHSTWVRSLILKVPAGSNPGSNRGRFVKNCIYLLLWFNSLQRFLQNTMSLLLCQTRFCCQAGDHKENLALSVSQNNQSGNMNVIGLESKCQASSSLSLVSIFHMWSSYSGSHKIKFLSIFWRQIQSKCHLVLGSPPEIYVHWEKVLCCAPLKGAEELWMRCGDKN